MGLKFCPSSKRSENSSASATSETLVGLGVVIAGIGLAVLTVFAHRSGERTLAIAAAVLSLGFVLLILIFVVPPLARNASREASQMNLPFEFTLGGAIMLGR